MKKGNSSAAGAQAGDLPLALRETLARLGKPVSASEVRKALPRPYQRPVAEIARHLDALVKGKLLFTMKQGQAVKYCGQDPGVAVREAVLGALGEGPLSKEELTKQVKRVAPGFEKGLAAALPAMLSRAEVREHPKVGKGKTRYGLTPPDPTPFLAKTVKELRALQKRLGAHGVTPAAVYAALGRALGIEGSEAGRGGAGKEGDPEDDASVLGALRELASRQPPGALLSVRALRGLRSLSKERFDRAVLRLSEGGKVVLHHHDFPASLPEAEREALVVDAGGVHYVGIAPKRAS